MQKLRRQRGKRPASAGPTSREKSRIDLYRRNLTRPQNLNTSAQNMERMPQEHGGISRKQKGAYFDTYRAKVRGRGSREPSETDILQRLEALSRVIEEEKDSWSR